MKRRLLSLMICLVMSGLALSAQTVQLAQQYFRNGEYEKAAEMYKELHQKNKQNDHYFDRYLSCIMALDQFKEAEDLLKKQLRRTPNRTDLYVTYGRLYELQYQDDKANEMYRQGIDNLTADRFAIIKMSNAFISSSKYNLAIETYKKGAALLKDNELFAYNLGDLYRRLGESEQMLEQYLNGLNANPNRLKNLKTIFQRYLTDEEMDELQAQLYERIQADQDALHYTELLTWVFIQRKDYRGALRQVRALDRRMEENGGRVFQLGEIAYNAQNYDVAIEAFDYIVDEKGVNSAYYLDAKQESLGARRDKLVAGFDYTEEELRKLESEYLYFLNEFGSGANTARIIMELAELEAFYLNDLPKATSLLSSLIDAPGLNKKIKANAKLQLADLYLMQGERWESTLLYSQVDKDFKEDLLGHEARFRNARLSYYMGDFEWAQSQFDILKASTSKLIANDALDLSVFIMDNLGLDSTATPLHIYATADLLAFQNRFDEAFVKLDELRHAFPEHGLQDDILYLRGNIERKQRHYDKAAAAYQEIVDNYPEDIRADNALYALAELYELHLDNKEKALELYERLFIDFSGSTFAVDARKRYRQLRGDEL